MIDEVDACYAVLDVTPTAGADEIRTAYFDLVKVWHPDRYLGESARLRGKAEEKLKQINLAYEKLRAGAPVFTTTSAGGRRDDIESPPELRPVDFGASWGYVDGEGKLVIEPRFAAAEPFSEGLAVVYEARRYGYIDSRGDYAIYPEFTAAHSFSEGLAAVVISVRWGFIDRAGHFVINPLYDDCSGFSEGLAAVEWRGRWGYIDNSGSFVVKPRYDGARSFIDGWAEVRFDRKWGKLNRQGEAFFAGQPRELPAEKS